MGHRLSPKRARGRRPLASLHRWCGLSIGWILLFTALTGVLMAFRPYVEPQIYPHFHGDPCSTPLSADDLLERAQAVKPNLETQYIRLFGDPTMAARVRFKGNDTVFLDPCTGAVLGDQNRYSGVYGWIEKMHTLHFGKLGTLIAGIDALVLFLALVAGGLYLLLPSLRLGWRRALTLDPRLDGRPRQMDLHRTIALYAAPILALIALTSLPQAFGWAQAAIYAAAGSPMAAAPRVPESLSPPIPVENVVRKARALAPGAKEVLVHIPHEAGQAYESFVIDGDAPHGNARTFLFVDPRNGETISFTPYSQSSLGSKIYFWTLSLHTGEAGGMLWRLVLVLAALTVPFLAFTGLRSYLGGIAQRRAHVVLHAPEAPTLAVVVAAVRQETDHVKQFDLAPADGGELPIATPGAHVDVHLGQGLVRQYSLINGPSERSVYRIAVRKSPESRGGSRRLHEEVKPGDLLAISAPRNHFPLVQGASHHLLIAGGIGITPLLSMARHLLEGGTSFSLEYFTRTHERTPFRNILKTDEFSGRVRFHHGVGPEELSIYAAALHPSHPAGAHAYICGGRTFIAAVESGLAESWPRENIHHEHFAADPSLWSQPRHAFELVLARSNHSLVVPADRTIAQALAEHGYPTATSCEQGVCGTCLAHVLAGSPDHRDAFLSDSQKAEGKLMMICVSRARGNRLVLDL